MHFVAASLQSPLDPQCRVAALWSDGGDGTIYLFQLKYDGELLLPELVTELATDAEDQLTRRNRAFTGDGSTFVFRRQGVWSAVDTDSGSIAEQFDAGQADSSGALTDNDVLLLSGFGENVRYHPMRSGGGRQGRVSAGPTPLVYPLIAETAGDGDEPTDAFLTVSADGLLTRFRSLPVHERFEAFPLQLPLEVRRELSYSPRWTTSTDGSLLARSLFFRGGERVIEVLEVSKRGTLQTFDCPGAVDFDILNTPNGIDVLAVTDAAVICRASLDRQSMTLGSVERIQTEVPSEALDMIRVLGSERLLIGSNEFGNFSLVQLASLDGNYTSLDWPSDTPIADVAVGPSGRFVVLGRGGLLMAGGSQPLTLPLPDRCEHVIGVSLDRIAANCDGRLYLVASNGSSVPLALPENANPSEAALSPDGKLLVMPLSDASNMQTRLYALLIDTGASYVFSPTILDELGLEDSSDLQGWLGQVGGVYFSPDGSRLFIETSLSIFSNLLVSNGPLDRFITRATQELTGLMVPEEEGRATFVYSSTGEDESLKSSTNE